VKAAGLGYETFFMGKWHLGDFWTQKDPKKINPPGLPPYTHPGIVGYDHWLATKASASSSMLNCACYPNNDTDCVTGGGVRGGKPLQCTNYWALDATHSIYPDSNVCNQSTGKEPGDDNKFIVDHFELWLRKKTVAATPFLATLWLHTVHVPHPAMPEFYNSVPYPSANGDYQGTIAQMDAQIGRIRALLKELGVANDTVVWYTSDNGPHKQTLLNGVSVGGYLEDGTYFNGLRQCKGSIFEGGVRVPGIIEWPAMIHSHRETWLPTGVYDYLPTVMEILKLKRPSQYDSWDLDGISILSWIEGGQFPSSRGKPIGLIQHDGAGTGTSAAWLDEEMKLVRNPGTGECGWIDGNYSDATAAGVYFLFNLTADPRETFDLKSDPAYTSKFTQMKAAHIAWAAGVYTSRSNETLCDSKSPTPPVPGPTPPGPTPPTPSPAGSFTLSPASDATTCIAVAMVSTKVPTASAALATSITLLPCAAGVGTQSWSEAPASAKKAKDGNGISSNAAGASPGAGFLKVNLKKYPTGDACNAGNTLTIGEATSGKIHAFFQWSNSSWSNDEGAGAALRGKLVNFGCPGMCLGADARKGAQLVTCSDAAASILRTPPRLHTAQGLGL
jgi:arylsulfatase A-like enzyme